jgi:FHA domain
MVTERAYLLVRGPDGQERRHELDPVSGPVSIGRGEGMAIEIHWDEEVSRLHALVEPIGQEWVLVDDGLSRNGSYVNGKPVSGRRRLRDNDELRIGATYLRFRAVEGGAGQTVPPAGVISEADISDAQRRVLLALCCPVIRGGSYALPATNRQIADKLYLSVETVKTHMRRLADALGSGELPRNAQRARIVEVALERGIVTPRDFPGIE